MKLLWTLFDFDWISIPPRKVIEIAYAAFQFFTHLWFQK